MAENDDLDHERPVSAIFFWTCATITIASVVGILWLAIADVPGGEFSILPRILLVALALIFGLASLATTKIIPPKGARTWAYLRRPKILGQIVFLFLSAAGFIVGISTIFNPAADRSGQEQLIKSTNTTLAKTNVSAATLTELDKWLRQKFPDESAILGQIGGQWGELQPACQLVWKIEIIRRGNDAALIAETVKLPPGKQQYRFVGSITKVTADTLYVEGAEPESAVGAAAHFKFDATTQRLSWDDRARGSGGVEIYRRCDS